MPGMSEDQYHLATQMYQLILDTLNTRFKHLPLNILEEGGYETLPERVEKVVAPVRKNVKKVLADEDVVHSKVLTKLNQLSDIRPGDKFKLPDGSVVHYIDEEFGYTLCYPDGTKRDGLSGYNIVDLFFVNAEIPKSYRICFKRNNNSF